MKGESFPGSLGGIENQHRVLFEKMPEMAAAYICVNNGENNILSLEVLGELQKCIEELSAAEDIRYAIFHSGRVAENGSDGQITSKVSSESAECSGYFSTGADIREMSTLDKEGALAYSKYGQGIMRSIQDLTQTTIAVIPHGFCVGGGLSSYPSDKGW